MGDPAGESSQTQATEAAVLLPIVYDELRALARCRLAREGANPTLAPTALVHEAYLRLAGAGEARFASRRQFFHAAAEAMRRILVDHARGKTRLKRGGSMRREPVNVLDLAAEPDDEQILALDEAIRRLEEQMPQAAAVVRLRFFAGLSTEETAECLDISPRTVSREWTYARASLYRMLDEGT